MTPLSRWRSQLFLQSTRRRSVRHGQRGTLNFSSQMSSFSSPCQAIGTSISRAYFLRHLGHVLSAGLKLRSFPRSHFEMEFNETSKEHLCKEMKRLCGKLRKLEQVWHRLHQFVSGRLIFPAITNQIAEMGCAVARHERKITERIGGHVGCLSRQAGVYEQRGKLRTRHQACA